MFKKIKKAILVSGAVVLLGVLFAACGTSSPFGRYERNLSELRDNVFVAYDDYMRIEVVSGRREEPFVIDGSSGESVPFTVITITPTAEARRDSFSYRVSMNDAEFTGNFLPHPFLDTFSCDIAASTSDRTITVVVTGGDDIERTFELTSIVNDEMIKAEDAFLIARERLDASLTDFMSGNRLNAEIYIRLVTNPITSSDVFFWYVAFVTSDSQTFAVLVDPMSSEILAVRE
ncbi:MAG: hypothetical protein FWC80_06765 [Firmicutes bacterium]|nr:hypothetical protein [Bacillota bacterium]